MKVQRLMVGAWGWMFAALSMALSGCVNLGKEPPASLLTLSHTETAQNPPDETVLRSRDALHILPFAASAKLDVLRVPVQVSQTRIAYLKEAQWVEKPAQLFRALVAETLKTRTDRVIHDGDVALAGPLERLSGTLREFGYDAPSGSVRVRFDARLIASDGTIRTRRFEAREEGVGAEADAVGEALNKAANDVARQVAELIAASE